ncbi:MAG: energy-coupling factor ABC transporter ATP-binding protein [Candidatus Syntropharchaeales archaeon]|nr:ATP-binding cassette domain-containing protein [Candidatus Syntrophoarchaeum sp.]
MENAICIRDLSYAYPDGTEALKEVSLEISRGESVALLGPNGAGKSTLMLHLNGILKGMKGSVEIFGDKIGDVDLKKIRKRVGIVFQDPDDQLFMPTLFDDLAFGPMNLELPQDEIKERVKIALRKVGLSGFEDRMPHHLSFGQKKRAAFATVLSMEPDILLLDEPTSNLDPRSRFEVIRVIEELRKEGKTIITATHDVNAVPKIAERVFILNKTMIGEGTMREVLLNKSLLQEANLIPPDVVQLFELLGCFGYDCRDLPLSMDEAVAHLTRTIETADGKHIHLHIHEHTHEKIEEVRGRYNHHE